MKSIYKVGILVLCIVLNYCGFLASVSFSLSIFLDSVGTILAGTLFGPLPGAIVGGLSNLTVGILDNWVSIPFGIINLYIGLVSGLLAKRFGLFSWVTAPAAILIFTLTIPLMAAPLSVYLFGGVTGGGLDLTIADFMGKLGLELLPANFLLRIPANFLDKLLSYAFVYGVIFLIPARYRGYANHPATRELP